VQRAVIAMRAKNVDFEVTYVNLQDKPDWFLEISPHGKVPVLKVDDEILFESNAIAEFLDETVPPRLHPEDPIARARNRAWTDYVPDFVKALNAIGYATTQEALDEGIANAPKAIARVEGALASRGNDGPYFNGDRLSLVDAAYGPMLQRFLLVEEHLQTGILNDFPLVKAWAGALLSNELVTGAVADNFAEEFVKNHLRRKTVAGSKMEARGMAAE
jgi:glutathione S-transferase